MKKATIYFRNFYFNSRDNIKSPKKRSETPEFTFSPYILETNNNLKSPENTDGKLETKFLGMGYGGGETY
jgi:hypothetical protein